MATQPLSITLRGITNDERDPSVDMLRAVTLPLLRQLTGVEDGWECKATARGAPPKVHPHKTRFAVLCTVHDRAVVKSCSRYPSSSRCSPFR